MIKLEENITNETGNTKREIISVFSEIILDTKKEPVNYVINWEAPGGGE